MNDAVYIESPVISRGRAGAVRCVGILFAFLGVAAAIAGLDWGHGAFRKVVYARAGSDGLLSSFFGLFVPTAIAVVGTWFLFWVGLGLLRRSSRARWAAVGTLVLVCVPPLVRVFGAIRVHYPRGAAYASLMVLAPALAILLLADAKTDPLFRPKAIVILEQAPAHSTSPWLKIVIVVLMFVMTLAVLATLARP